MSNILVTGGAGYIGSHTAKALAAAGFTPVVYDNLTNGHRWAVRWGPLAEGDVTDRAHLDAVLAEYRPDAVVHFAGLIEAGRSMREPAAFYRANVVGSAVLLDAMRTAGIARIVFSSSAAVYGTPEAVPIDEAAPRRPVNPYGHTKLAVEYMLADFAAAYGLSYASLRYFNAAGADADGEIGEAHDPETHLVPIILEVARGDRPMLEVFGTDYATPDGTAIRDYIHVSDLADAHVAAVRRLAAGGADVTVNLGTGRGYSVREIIAAARTATGHAIPAEDRPRRPGDPPELVAAAGRAASELDWRPQQSDIATILATAWRWHQGEPPAGP